MRRPTRVAALVLAASMAGGTLVGCGISEDGKPRQISREALPPELIDPSVGTGPTAGEGLQLVSLYLVDADEPDGEVLVPVQQSAPLPSDPAEVPGAVIEALAAATPEALGRSDLVNAVPSDLEVRSAILGDDGVLAVDLGNLGNVESAMQRLAVAQLVFTLTELGEPRVRALRFADDGQDLAVPVESGVAPPGAAITRFDEPDLVRRSATTTTTVTATSTTAGPAG